MPLPHSGVIKVAARGSSVWTTSDVENNFQSIADETTSLTTHSTSRGDGAMRRYQNHWRRKWGDRGSDRAIESALIKKMVAAGDSEEPRQCTMCKALKGQMEFSRKQWQNGKSRKCEACVGGDSTQTGQTNKRQTQGDENEQQIQIKKPKHTKL